MGPVEELGEVGRGGLKALVARLKARYGERIAGELVQPPVAARYAELPVDLDLRRAGALRARGVERLYSHQAADWDLVQHRSVLDVAAFADADLFNIAAEHGTGPDTGVPAHRDQPNHDSFRRNENMPLDARYLVSKSIDSHLSGTS